jgi:hypothetical protein
MKPKHFPARSFDRTADWPGWLTSEERALGHGGLYRFYDADRELLYVGISRQMTVRWSAHRNTAAWWSRAEYVAVSYFPPGCRVYEDMAEKASIAHEQPPFNTNHRNPSRAVAKGLLPYLPPPGFEVGD